MEDHEFEGILKVYRVLSSDTDITPELRMYLTGITEQILGKYQINTQADVHSPKRLTQFFKTLKGD